ncbi:NAD(P)-binding protein [Leucogyrophana mollusca]|uniref:NAD(P)-binding protein n=1 Tax=Leucogyrophana mollusca TaxID=85980 RepID=A0ACB8BFU2_9AGAM|nr:NAD(P)-binding protein [Leucogyrophana mollusca]
MAPALVTGASSGFGRSVTEAVLARGDTVVATLRHPPALSNVVAKYDASRLLVLSLDVTKPDEICVAFSEALQAFGRIDVVFNNAGSCVVGEAEGMSEEHARGLFEVLFWGAANVTKEAVKTFRDVNKPPGGRLLQMSSRTALEVLPGCTHYAAAKAALECLSEGYAAELDPTWNIKITLVEPALFRTQAPRKNILAPVHPAYTNPLLPSRKYRSLYGQPGIELLSNGDSDKLASAMYRLATLDDPPFRLPLHKVALDAAGRKGRGLLEAANTYKTWSDDIYLDDDNTIGKLICSH